MKMSGSICLMSDANVRHIC